MNKTTIKHSLARAGLLPSRCSISYALQTDRSVQTTVTGFHHIGGRAVLRAVFEITAGGRIRLAYDGLTGEALAV